MKTISLACVTLAAVLSVGATTANARDCITKSAVATAPTVDQAKWFALETTVQLVSWGLWPGYVASSKVEGYNVADKYRCKPDGGQQTCHVDATFCKK